MRRRVWIPWVVIGTVVAVGGVVTVAMVPPILAHRDAQQRYDNARSAWNEAQEEVTAAYQQWQESDRMAQSAIETAHAVVPDVARAYLDDDLVGTVDDLLRRLDVTEQPAPDISTLDMADSDPQTTAELEAHADAYESQTRSFHESAAR